MTGVEFVVGGWFASAAIRKIVDKAGVYLGDNCSVHKKTKEMLNNLKNRLPEMQAILEEAEKQQIKNEGITEWLKLIKVAAYEAEDLLDDFEAKRIRENFNSKDMVRKAASSIAKGAKKLLLADDDVSKLIAAVNNIEQLCNQLRTFLGLLKLDLDFQAKDLPSTNTKKITPILQHDQPLFGRDNEIKLILSIILGYEIDYLEHETISLEMASEIESLEHDRISEGIGNEIESLRHMEFLGVGTSFHKIGQNMLGMMRQKLWRWLGEIEGVVAAESVQESLTITGPTAGTDSGTEVEPESSQKSSDRMKAASTIDVGSRSSLLERIWQIRPSQDKSQKLLLEMERAKRTGNYGQGSSQGKAQNLLLEMNPTQQMGNYGRPFVIPIVGISGIGKTAIAQTIYSHPQLKDHFVLRRWFYMSQEYDVDTMVMAFVPAFDPNDPSDLKAKFIREITGKRILVVLDGVCSKVCLMFENIRNWFSSVAFGSVILVTTEEREVADKLGTIDPIILNILEWNHFLPLLEYYAFQNANITNEKREALKSICEVIGRPLPRLPLVAKLIGSLLRSDVDQDRWKLVSRIPWNNLGDGCISSILENCYKDLNSKLRLCFVLCSIFPPNYIIEKDRIVQMWIANNFIQTGSTEGSMLEDIGRMWFDELVNRSFFLPTPWPRNYIMHSAIRELAVAVFSKECFVFDENPNHCPEGCFLLSEHSNPCFHGYSVIHNGTLKVPDTARHLTLIKSELDLVPGTRWYSKLHTLLFYGYCPVPYPRYSSSMLTATRKLRVLELSYPGAGAERHLNAIGELSHLRFLDLSFTGISELRDSLCSLCHLQVLDIRGCKFKRLPKNMNHLINLRHLYASNQTINLVSEIGKLTLLQELEQFWVSRLKGHTISELTEMNEIGEHLSIINLHYVEHKDEVQKARLEDKKRLKSLSLRWNRNHSYRDQKDDFNVLNSLQPHSSLEMLEIVNYLDTLLPSWMTLTLLNIRCIHLKGCSHLKNLPPFGKLHHLENIILDGLSIEHIGEDLYGPDEVIFPALKVLKFIAMNRWKIWSPSGERELLPRLEELEIQDCYNLTETPFHSLKLLCLKKLELSCCSEVLLKGSICDKPLPLLSSIYISAMKPCTMNLLYANFPNLQTLSLKNICIQFKGNQQSLSNLKRVNLRNSKINWNGVPVLSKLTEIKISFAINNILEMVEPLEAKVGDLRFSSLPSLKMLSITSHGLCFWVNPSNISMLEDWFEKLPHLVELTANVINISELSFASLGSLKTLHFGAKSGIKNIPENSMPQNLKELYIYEASNDLVNRCLPEQGEDWLKIKHIPYIRINGKTLQMI